MSVQNNNNNNNVMLMGVLARKHKSCDRAFERTGLVQLLIMARNLILSRNCKKTLLLSTIAV